MFVFQCKDFTTCKPLELWRSDQLSHKFLCLNDLLVTFDNAERLTLSLVGPCHLESLCEPRICLSSGVLRSSLVLCIGRESLLCWIVAVLLLPALGRPWRGSISSLFCSCSSGISNKSATAQAGSSKIIKGKLSGVLHWRVLLLEFFLSLILLLLERY